MIASAMESALTAPAGSAGLAMAPALVAADPVLAAIGWTLVAFVVVFLATLLGVALGEYDPPEAAPRIRQPHLACTAATAAVWMTPAA